MACVLWADPGPALVKTYPGGASLVQITAHTQIALASETVELSVNAIGNRIAASPGFVGFSTVHELANQSDERIEVTVAFPIAATSTFSKHVLDLENSDSHDIIKALRFHVADEETSYAIELHRQAEPYQAAFVWTMDFAPRQVRTVRARYRLPMKESKMQGERVAAEHNWAPYANRASRGTWYSTEFVSGTGLRWAGDIGRSVFTVAPTKYFSEQVQLGTAPFASGYSTRRITPQDGWRFHDGSATLVKSPRQSVEMIEVAYFVTSELPREVEQLTEMLGAGTPLGPADREAVAQIYLALEGIAPEIEAVRNWAEQQQWYRPDPAADESSIPLHTARIVRELRGQ